MELERVWYKTETGPYNWPITLPAVVIKRTAKRVKIAIPHKYERGQVMLRSVTPEHIEPRNEPHKFDKEYLASTETNDEQQPISTE